MLKPINSNIEPIFHVVLFTVTSWREFLALDQPMVGFNLNREKQAQKLKNEDILIAYLTKVSRFIGILRVSGQVIINDSKVWSESNFPIRVPVKIESMLEVENAIPIMNFKGKLSFLEGENPKGWTSYIRSSPRKWENKDALIVTQFIRDNLKANFKVPSKTTQKIYPQEMDKAYRRISSGNKKRVSSNIKKNQNLKEIDLPLDKNKRVLSENRVTGYSVNFPIFRTCKPTVVCRETCYFAVGYNATPSALQSQEMNYRICCDDPIYFAKRVINEYDNFGLNYLRWNGGGDLFSEAVRSINHIGKTRKDLKLWVVTRLPKYAFKIQQFQNVYIHVSLDKSTYQEKEQDLKQYNSSNVFFSYQAAPSENIDSLDFNKISVIFRHDYGNLENSKLTSLVNEKLCPLNGNSNINNACAKCRRCFNGEAILMRGS